MHFVQNNEFTEIYLNKCTLKQKFYFNIIIFEKNFEKTKIFGKIQNLEKNKFLKKNQIFEKISNF